MSLFSLPQRDVRHLLTLGQDLRTSQFQFTCWAHWACRCAPECRHRHTAATCMYHQRPANSGSDSADCPRAGKVPLQGLTWLSHPTVKSLALAWDKIDINFRALVCAVLTTRRGKACWLQSSKRSWPGEPRKALRQLSCLLDTFLSMAHRLQIRVICYNTQYCIHLHALHCLPVQAL